MAAARIGVPASPTNRNDRAALGVIATYLHELTEHGRPREQQLVEVAPAPAATPVFELATLGELDDELAAMAEPAGASCFACAA